MGPRDLWAAELTWALYLGTKFQPGFVSTCKPSPLLTIQAAVFCPSLPLPSLLLCPSFSFIQHRFLFSGCLLSMAQTDEMNRVAAGKDFIIHHDLSNASLQSLPILDCMSLDTFPSCIPLTLVKVGARASLAELQKDSQEAQTRSRCFQLISGVAPGAPSALSSDLH